MLYLKSGVSKSGAAQPPHNPWLCRPPWLSKGHVPKVSQNI